MNLIYYNIIKLIESCGGWTVGRREKVFSLLKVVVEYCKLKYKNKLVNNFKTCECTIVIRDGKYVAHTFYGWGLCKVCKIKIIERGNSLCVFVPYKDFMKWVRILCGEEIYEGDL